MNARLVEPRTNDLLLEMVETHLFARDRDPFAGEKGKERILHAFGRILRERFMKDPRIVGVEMEGQLFLRLRPGRGLRRDSRHNGVERLDIVSVRFPCGVSDAGRGDIFLKQTRVFVLPSGLNIAEHGEKGENDREKSGFHLRGSGEFTSKRLRVVRQATWRTRPGARGGA